MPAIRPFLFVIAATLIGFGGQPAAAQFTAGGSSGVGGDGADAPADGFVDGLNRLAGGRVAYVRTADDLENAVLLVWCHPSGGDAQPEFKWLTQHRLHKQGIVVLCPQSAGRGWSVKADGTFVGQAIAAAVKQYKIDPARIILGGHSSGGHFVYRYGLANPEAFHMVIPAAGALVDKPAPASCDAPIWHPYHSRNDKVVPYKRATDSLAALDAAGYVTQITTDNQRHSVATKTVNIAIAAAKYLRGEGLKPISASAEVGQLLGGDAGWAMFSNAETATAARGEGEPDPLDLKTRHKLLIVLSDPAVYDLDAGEPDAIEPDVTLTFSEGEHEYRLVFAAGAQAIETISAKDRSYGRARLTADGARRVTALLRCALRTAGRPAAGGGHARPSGGDEVDEAELNRRLQKVRDLVARDQVALAELQLKWLERNAPDSQQTQDAEQLISDAKSER